MSMRINDKPLIPAPFVNVTKNVGFTQDGRTLSSNYQITLNGTLLPNRGSPNSKGWHYGTGEPDSESYTTDADKFDSILAKQECLREAFQVPGAEFSWSSPESFNIECYPALKSINFTPGTWVTKSDYTIVLETDALNRYNTSEIEECIALGASGLNLSDITDDWSIKERPDVSGVYDISRNVSASARVAYTTGSVQGTEPWMNARTWVQARLTSDPLPSGLSIFSLTNGTLYNKTQEEDINESNGFYSIRENYVYSHNNYFETRNVSRTTEYNQTSNSGADVINITVNGTINGLDVEDDLVAKLANARTYWNSIKSGLGLSVGACNQATNISTTEDETDGSISYNASFINNSGSIFSNTYNVSINYNENAYPNVQIQGRIEGITCDNFSVSGTTNLKYDYAVSGWDLTKGNLKSLAFASNAPFGISEALFADSPLSKTLGFNKVDGSIDYNYNFGYLDGSSSDNYTDTYDIIFDTENGPASSVALGGHNVTATINGKIVGTLTDDTDPSSKITNATNGWATIRTDLFSRVDNLYSTMVGTTRPLSSGFISRGTTVNRVAGSVGYSARFNNNPLPTSSGIVAIENVSVQETKPGDIFVQQVIPGRTSGPIWQDINTIGQQVINIDVNMLLHAKSFNSAWTYSDKNVPEKASSGLINDIVSDWGVQGTGWFKQSDSDTWDWNAGSYNRNFVAVRIV